MVPGEEPIQDNSLEILLPPGEIFDLRVPESIDLMRLLKQEYPGANDNRKYISGFINKVVESASEDTPLLYSPLIIQYDLTVQLLSYGWKGERYFKVGINSFMAELRETEVYGADSLKNFLGIDTFPPVLLVEAFEKIEADLLVKMQAMSLLAKGTTIYGISLRKIDTGQLRKLFEDHGINVSSQNQELPEK